MDEVKILQRVSNHENVIKIFDVYETDQYLLLVLELVHGGDLFDRIISLQGEGFPESRARSAAKLFLSELPAHRMLCNVTRSQL